MLYFPCMDMSTLYGQMTAVEKRRWADEAGTSPAYLSQIVNGHRVCGALLALRLAAAPTAGGRIQAHEIRSDLKEHLVVATISSPP